MTCYLPGLSDGITPEAVNAMDTTGFVYCCGLVAVERALKSIGVGQNRQQKAKLLQSILETGGRAYAAPLPEHPMQLMDDVSMRYPNLSDLTDYMSDGLALSGLVDDAIFSLKTPVLLDGPQGVGKTHALSYLAKRLAMTARKVSCSDASNGFDLVGLSSGWGTGKPAMVATLLIEDQCANPIFVLDEVDKANKDEKCPLEKTLYRLLESDTAREFRDEYLDVELNATCFNWMATCNDASKIPVPILDRFRVIEARSPTAAERYGIARLIYQDMLSENQWGARFVRKLSSNVASQLAECEDVSVRGMRNALYMAAAKAARRGKPSGRKKIFISSDDMRLTLKNVQPHPAFRIGF